MKLLAITVSLIVIAPVPLPRVSAAQAGIVVDTLSNADDGTDGRCSIREAIIAANMDADYNECSRTGPGADDVITFSVSGTILLNSGQLPSVLPGGRLTINGGGISIDANRSSRIFHVASGGDLVLNGLRLLNGYVSGSDGGAVFNEGGSISINNVTFSDNEVEDGFGGAIANRNGRVTISDSGFLRNRLPFGGEGGAVFNVDGEVEIQRSTFSENLAEGGGAIFQTGLLARLTISDTTFSDNRAAFGGALHVDQGNAVVVRSTFTRNQISGGYAGAISNFGTMVITNSTISGNEARGGSGGGGILSGGELTLSFVTVAYNSADAGGGGIRTTGVGTTRVKNSIVAGNSPGGNCVGPLTPLGGNLDDDGTCFGGTGTPSINLGPLQNNGGLTWTHALQFGSTALDAAVDCADAFGAPVSEDQRGIPRPQPTGGGCDAGAYEARRFTLTVSRTGTGTGTVTSAPTGISCDPDCSELYPEGTLVSLTAVPDPGSSFSAWGGACSGTTPTTAVTMNADKTCTARFERAMADLSIRKSASSDPVLIGQTLSYRIEVRNLGPSDATLIEVRDVLPEGAILSRISGAGWGCGVIGTEVVCALPSLPAGAFAPPLHIEVRVPFVADALVNSARVSSSSPDPQIRNNSSSVETPVVSPALVALPFRLATITLSSERAKQGLLVPDPIRNRVRVFLSREDGTLARGQVVPVGPGPVAIAVGDLTGDGATDAVTANFVGRSMTVLQGRGDGTFNPTRTIPVPGRPRALAVGDLDQDGRLDLVLAYWDTGRVQVFKGRGDGTFAAGRDFEVGKQPIALAVADVNGDGRLDVVVANWGSHSVTILVGRGDGAFTLAGETIVGTNPISLIIGDVDRDGRVEVITANHGESSLSLVRIEDVFRDGRTIRLHVMATVPTVERPIGIGLGPWGTDGTAIVCASAVVPEAWVYRISERGVPQLHQQLFTATPSAATAVMDFNGDQYLDTVLLDATGERMEIWLSGQGGMLRRKQ
ncbi:hypothetical protein HRbin10_01638 [bacterium HR10]|nr:hypothetical protein HRbin10_01638 [bacterium HR10]